MHLDIGHKLGAFQLTARDGVNHVTFSAYMHNNLWNHYQLPATSPSKTNTDTLYASVRSFTN